MRQLTVRKTLDLALYVLLCALLATGALIHFRLVAGSPKLGWTLWGWDRHQWGELHTWLSYGFVALILVHLAVNFTFVRKVMANQRTWRWAGLLAGGLVFIGAFLLLPLSEGQAVSGHGLGGHGLRGHAARAGVGRGLDAKAVSHHGGRNRSNGQYRKNGQCSARHRSSQHGNHGQACAHQPERHPERCRGGGAGRRCGEQRLEQQRLDQGAGPHRGSGSNTDPSSHADAGLGDGLGRGLHRGEGGCDRRHSARNSAED